MPDVIVVGGVEWSEEANQPPSQVVRALAKSHRVLYVYSETQGSRLSNLVSPVMHGARRRLLRKSLQPMQYRQVADSIWVAPLRGLLGTLPLSFPEPLRRVNAAMLARFLRKASADLGFADPVLWFYWWFFPELIDDVPHSVSVYDCIDEHSAYSRWKMVPVLGRSAAKNEERLLRSVDACFFVSPATMEKKNGQCGNASYAPNGIDIECATRAVARGGSLPEMVTLSHPIIGYAGAIDARIDIQLVRDVAQRRREWSFVFIGGYPPNTSMPPNVTFIPPRPYAEMLRAVRDFDVAILPFIDNEFTRGCSPLKLLDYLFVGRRIVSTPLPAAKDLQSDAGSLMAIANGPSEWECAIESALTARSTDDQTNGRSIARRHSTEDRVSGMFAQIQQIRQGQLTATSARAEVVSTVGRTRRKLPNEMYEKLQRLAFGAAVPARWYVRHLPHGLGAWPLVLIVDRVLRRQNRAFRAKTTSGTQFSGRTGDLVDRYIYEFGVWEPNLTAWLRNRLRPQDTFVDVGAHIGYFTVLASKLVGPDGAVVAIEASPDICCRLVENVARNGCTNVRIVNVAVSDTPGEAVLFRGPIWNRSAASTLPNAGMEAEAQVEALPLVDVLTAHEIQQARIVKIDIEGSEFAAVRGLVGALDCMRQDVEFVIEVSPERLAMQGDRADDVVELMAEHGFHAYKIENDYRASSYVGRRRRCVDPVRWCGPIEGQCDLIFSRINGASI